jgi:hypothetical protein
VSAALVALALSVSARSVQVDCVLVEETLAECEPQWAARVEERARAQ